MSPSLKSKKKPVKPSVWVTEIRVKDETEIRVKDEKVTPHLMRLIELVRRYEDLS